MYFEVVNFDFDKFDDLNNYLKNHIDENFLLFIHVFKEDKRGYSNAIKKQIEREYPSISIHWVTGDKPGLVSDEIKESKNVFTYNEISDRIDDNTLKFHNLSKKITEKKRSDGVYIFISHSSEDKDIINSFYENILRIGLNVTRESVFLSCNPSTSIHTGDDIPDSLKKELEKMTLFINYISDNYKKSEVCLIEMGAAWFCLQKSKIITIKAPDISFKEVGFLDVQRIGLSVNNKNDLLKLFDDYSMFFPNCKMTDFNKKIDEFLEQNGFL